MKDFVIYLKELERAILEENQSPLADNLILALQQIVTKMRIISDCETET